METYHSPFGLRDQATAVEGHDDAAWCRAELFDLVAHAGTLGMIMRRSRPGLAVLVTAVLAGEAFAAFTVADRITGGEPIVKRLTAEVHAFPCTPELYDDLDACLGIVRGLPEFITSDALDYRSWSL